jgi:hypothetical protein
MMIQNPTHRSQFPGTLQAASEVPESPESPEYPPSDFPLPEPTTGTEDDDDAPEDEHPGENEAEVREHDENTEAPEEFDVDDEDRAAR